MRGVCRRLFIDHPRSVDESYWQHMGQALYFSTRMFAGSLACLLHALIPGAFERTGSGIVSHLHDRMVVNRRRVAADDATTRRQTA